MKQPYFLADGARLIGNIHFGNRVSVWFNAVLRGDEGRIEIGDNSNVQDNCTVHNSPGTNTTIGRNVTVGHNAILHGCTIGDNVLIGMGAIVMDNVVIGENSIVGAGALVTKNTVVPAGSLVIGSPAKVRRALTEEEQRDIAEGAKKYLMLAERYVTGDLKKEDA